MPAAVPMTARSLLFAPGDSERKLAKASASGADLVLIDLEDAVANVRKAEARAMVAAHLDSDQFRHQPQWVRINPLESEHALHDLAAIVPARPDGIMLPKADRAGVDRLNHYLTALEVAAGLPPGDIPVIAIAGETAPALFGLGDYAGAPRLAALTWGAEDSAAALGAINNREADGEYAFPYQLFRSLCLAGAAAARVPAIETIHADFRDTDGLARVAARAHQAGFKGMMAIHPDQVPIINQAFSPSDAELGWAERVISAFEAAPDAGTIGIDGEMFDMPHLKRARALLAMRRNPQPT